MAREREPSSSSQNSPLLRFLPYILFGAFGAWVLVSKRHSPMEDSNDSNEAQDNATNQAYIRENGTKSPLRVIVDSMPPSNAPVEDARTKLKRERREVWLFRVHVGTLIALIIYSGITFGILCVTSNQTNLLRQQLVGTQGAVVEISPVWDATKQMLSTILVNSNQNGVSGVVSNFRARLQRKTWPKEQPTGEPFIIELPTPEITILKGGQFPIDKGLPWPLPPQMEDQSLWPGNEVVTLEGSFTYNDGFGDLYPYKFCYLWTAPWNLTSPKAGGRSGGQWSGGKQGCPTVQEKVNEFLGYKAVFERANR